MSNALALAAVTAVLKDLLDNALIDQSISSVVGSSVTVSALPPDRIETGENETPRLNLYLYRVTPNTALRNVDLPATNGRGRRVANPPLALDLHYMLTAYCAQDFDAEILLGYAVQLLHETPVLDRDAIRRTLAPPAPVSSGMLPPALGLLAASDLADQVELVKITPQPVATEDLSKLWTAFGASYRPSAAYLASVVLIESRRSAVSALPVLTRGEADPVTGKERGVVAQASMLPPYPLLSEVAPPDEQSAVRMGELLVFTGRNLEADSVGARFVHVRTGEVLELDAEPGATPISFSVRIPPDPPAAPPPPGSPLDPVRWRAGVYAVSGIVRRAGQEDRLTNPLPVALAPSITPTGVTPAPGGAQTVAVTVRPPVHASQHVRLVVGSLEVPVTPFSGDTASAVDFTSTAFASGSQWLRLRVDEVESLLVDRSATPPEFDPSQQVTIP